VKYVISIVALIVFGVYIGMNSAWAEEYRLGPGDVLTIGVWGYEDLQVKELVVRPDGKVAFPIAGELQVTGLSSGELAELFTKRLSQFINNPIVTVNITVFRTTRIYVLGEVIKPGMYEMEKQHNLLDAIGIAGGYTKNAAKKQVLILRKDQMGHPINVNLLKLLQKGDMTQNYALGEGDVVYLSDNGKINFATDILPWVSATYQVVRINKP